jgi:hypothetical protein
MNNSLSTKNPKLAKEWHPTKNEDLTPNDVSLYSNKKVWWQCNKGHEWQATISSRSIRNGCPYCSNNKVCIDNCLSTTNPELAKEWHPTKNINLTPNDVTAGSSKKVWWKCNDGHEWESSLNYRDRKGYCPYCRETKWAYPVSEGNCLSTINPELVKQWHPTKNEGLSPQNFRAGSGKMVWWQCRKGHEWEESIRKRNRGMCCPYCIPEDNSLSAVSSELTKQWHPTKNGELTPSDVAAGSNKKAWWQCNEGHEWKATINSRSSSGNGCPYCYNESKKGIRLSGCLSAKNPELAKEWHPTKNGDLTPSGIAADSSRKVWWQCAKGHEWQTRVFSRNSGGTKCPKCQNEARTLNNDYHSRRKQQKSKNF